MKKYLLVGLLAAANIATAACNPRIGEKCGVWVGATAGVDYDTRDNPTHVDSRKTHMSFECVDGYLYMYFTHNETAYISTDPTTGKGGFTKC